ncbi:hypothetical protein ACOMHN_022373 [Nucella lapillus]
MRLLLFLWLASLCQGTWFEENVYKDSKRVVEEDNVSSEQRNGLLSVLLSLDKLYEEGRAAVSKADKESFGHKRATEMSREEFAYDVDDDDDDDDASVLNSVLKDIKATNPSKRGRYDISGVLPPLGELCRVMHVRGCSHSRHR